MGRMTALLTLACLATLAQTPEGATPQTSVPGTDRTVYRDRAFGFEIEVPDGWRLLLDDTLEQQFAGVVEEGAAPPGFRAGLQPAAHGAVLRPPYALVQTVPYTQMGLDGVPEPAAMQDVLRGISGAELVERSTTMLTPEARERLAHVDMDTATFDPESFRFRYAIEVDRGADRLRGEAAGLFGRYAFMQVLVYGEPENWAATAAVRSQLTRSFTALPDARLPENYGQPSPVLRFVVMVVGGAVAGALGLWFGVQLRRRAQRRPAR